MRIRLPRYVFSRLLPGKHSGGACPLPRCGAVRPDGAPQGGPPGPTARASVTAPRLGQGAGNTAEPLGGPKTAGVPGGRLGDRIVQHGAIPGAHGSIRLWLIPL